MIATKAATNGFIKGNPHGCENCSIVPNTINEMLCMSHRGVVRLFPVWPKEMDARFAQLRAWGAFLISAELKNGMVRNVEIFSEKGRSCTMVNPWPGSRVIISRADDKKQTLSGERFTFETTAGEKLRLLPVSE
jgi:hypothetical protein